mmetsp:Transcript_36569/g.32788  ORF Transcript_36569/g.32788 Transcript_36569/m.32788 type:complete len:244 (-) Transcript_36569:384-1115(-)
MYVNNDFKNKSIVFMHKSRGLRISEFNGIILFYIEFAVHIQFPDLQIANAIIQIIFRQIKQTKIYSSLLKFLLPFISHLPKRSLLIGIIAHSPHNNQNSSNRLESRTQNSKILNKHILSKDAQKHQKPDLPHKNHSKHPELIFLNLDLFLNLIQEVLKLMLQDSISNLVIPLIGFWLQKFTFFHFNYHSSFLGLPLRNILIKQIKRYPLVLAPPLQSSAHYFLIIFLYAKLLLSSLGIIIFLF